MAVYTRRTLTNFISRSLSSPSSPSPLLRSRYSITTTFLNTPTSRKFSTRPRTSSPGYSPLNDPSPNWSNRPPKETILLDGCDYEHWLIVLEFPDPKPSDEEMVNAYVKTLAHVVGSEEEAKKKIYSVSTTTYTGFGALIPEELSHKLKEVPGVLWVLPDSYLDVPSKDYGGDLFVDGKVIVRPQFHFDQRHNNTRRPRPRYDRRRETMPVERREPMQSGNWTAEQRGPGSQPPTAGGQNSFNNGPPRQSVPGAQPATVIGQNSFNRDHFPNQVQYNRGGV